jgi:hypothetical protein
MTVDPEAWLPEAISELRDTLVDHHHPRSLTLLKWEVSSVTCAMALVESTDNETALVVGAAALGNPTELVGTARLRVWPRPVRDAVSPFELGRKFWFWRCAGAEGKETVVVLVPSFGRVRSVGEPDASDVAVWITDMAAIKFRAAVDPTREWVLSAHGEPNWKVWTNEWPSMIETHAPLHIPNLPKQRPDRVWFGAPLEDVGTRLDLLAIRYGSRILWSAIRTGSLRSLSETQRFLSHVFEEDFLEPRETIDYRDLASAHVCDDDITTWLNVVADPQVVRDRLGHVGASWSFEPM